MNSFTPVASLVGGVLIGIAAAGMLVFHGRIAGISGIAGGIVRRQTDDTLWRVMFLAGLFLAGVLYSAFDSSAYQVAIARSAGALVAAGVLVGIGTQLGSGCTSGHGVCGVGRFSKRSFVATAVFMATGAATVWVVRRFFQGVL